MYSLCASWERTPVNTVSRERDNMATLKVKIENGNIVWHNHTYVSDESPTYVLGNGWHVWIDRKRGKIICHAEREYSTGLAVKHKEFRLQDGLVGCSGGDVRNAYAYFRKQEFQNFMDELGIDAVRHEDPNEILVTGYSAYPNAYVRVKTDGGVEELPMRQDSVYDGYWQEFKVCDATWLVVHAHNYCRDRRNDNVTLYTLQKDVLDLKEQIKNAQWRR